mmetsp:Transcript_33701/g.86419  ORF Transcript_33701/g.86419 Transcript_33701/m.86419 type:complete len:222 (+) Transcript_33701:197-862(+)
MHHPEGQDHAPGSVALLVDRWKRRKKMQRKRGSAVPVVHCLKAQVTVVSSKKWMQRSLLNVFRENSRSPREQQRAIARLQSRGRSTCSLESAISERPLPRVDRRACQYFCHLYFQFCLPVFVRLSFCCFLNEYEVSLSDCLSIPLVICCQEISIFLCETIQLGGGQRNRLSYDGCVNQRPLFSRYKIIIVNATKSNKAMYSSNKPSWGSNAMNTGRLRVRA